MGRAKAAAPAWFGRLPKADVAIEPYPAYREKNGANEYNPPAEDGSRPGLFYISAYQAEKQSRAIAESTAFHETIPGHHLQSAIALERRDMHPIGRYIFNSGYAEGWGLYAERLADEMKLFSGDLDRLGMLGSQALRAARLVVDSGLHTQGWTRQQAIDYMLAHTAEAPDYIASEVDRYIIWPGQATSYMLGMLEIMRAREDARTRLGPAFSIKTFHDQVLEDGGVPLSALTAKIRRWDESRRRRRCTCEPAHLCYDSPMNPRRLHPLQRRRGRRRGRIRRLRRTSRHRGGELHVRGTQDVRRRGVRVLNHEELQAGDVSLEYVSRLMNRRYTDAPTIRKILQTHLVSGEQRPGNLRRRHGARGWHGARRHGLGRGIRQALQQAAACLRPGERRLVHAGLDRTGSARAASDAPVITHPHFTGTGTRTMHDNGRAAIEALFTRSFGASS